MKQRRGLVKGEGTSVLKYGPPMEKVSIGGFAASAVAFVVMH